MPKGYCKGFQYSQTECTTSPVRCTRPLTADCLACDVYVFTWQHLQPNSYHVTNAFLPKFAWLCALTMPLHSVMSLPILYSVFYD